MHAVKCYSIHLRLAAKPTPGYLESRTLALTDSLTVAAGKRCGVQGEAAGKVNMADRAEVLESLRSVLTRAKFTHEQASSAFHAVAAQYRQLPRVPGSAQPPGGEQLRAAFSAELQARQSYMEALRNFNYCSIQTTVPMHSEIPLTIMRAADTLPPRRETRHRTVAGKTDARKNARSEKGLYPVLKRAS